MRELTALVAAAVILLGAAEVEAAKGKGKKKNNANITSMSGTVSSVKAEKNGGTLTVKHHANTKNANKTAQEKTFKVTKETLITKVSGKKKNRQTAAAALGDLQEGALVKVTAHGDHAQSIQILAKGKAKNQALAKINKVKKKKNVQ
jgi:hypothetical protein